MNIYVGNLSLEVTEEELRQEFTSFGEVTAVIIMNDKYIGSGQQRGYGYVEMAKTSEGETAVTSLSGKKLKNREIDVIKALPLSDRKMAGTLQRKGINRFKRSGRQRIY